MRLSQAARKLNIGTDTLIAYLEAKGFVVDNNPNSKITVEQFDLLAAEFVSTGLDKQKSASVKFERSYTSVLSQPNGLNAEKQGEDSHKATCHDPLKDQKVLLKEHDQPIHNARAIKQTTVKHPHYESVVPAAPSVKTLGKIDLDAITPKWPKTTEGDTSMIGEDKLSSGDQDNTSFQPTKEQAEQSRDESRELDQHYPADDQGKSYKKIALDTKVKIKEPTVLGKIVLPVSPSQRRPNTKSTPLVEETTKISHKAKIPSKPLKGVSPEEKGVSSQEIKNQIKKTLAKLNQGIGHGIRAKSRKERNTGLDSQGKQQDQEKANEKVLKVTEFISANELASLMGVTVNNVLSTCMSLGIIASINQRLDAETIVVVADEFGYEVQFVDVLEKEFIETPDETTEDLEARSPIVTIMGHVDHGKTSLLDYIRTTRVIDKEAGGITQHIGAYDVVTKSGKKIVFLDTPGHEAFTAMRTRGARLTDIIVIVVAADDSVMPQTKEAISHAQVAGCPIIIAINKIDKPQANPEKVKEDLANQNILVEDWGGKYQCQEVSAKTGQGVDELLEKILLEADLLELKANGQGLAKGTVIESFLDPGRGYVATVMVQEGRLHVGDIVFAGVYYGKVKVILNCQGKKQAYAEPVTPVQILGLNGAPRAGDLFRVMSNLKEATELAQKKQQLLREQSLRTKSYLTLDEIGRRLSIGNFKKLNLIIKGDVDGSIEALADALLKLSHEEVEINILHKCVGSVSESDVLLASTAGAVIIAFHIKLSAQVKQLAERHRVEIKSYSIIYDAIDDVRNLVQGLLSSIIEEVTTGRAQVKKIFKISKVGNIAGCQVQMGYIQVSNPIRVIRKDQVIFTGSIHTLKHGLEEIKQAKAASECGIHIKNFDQIELDDIIEGFERKEIQRKL